MQWYKPQFCRKTVGEYKLQADYGIINVRRRENETHLLSAPCIKAHQSTTYDKLKQSGQTSIRSAAAAADRRGRSAWCSAVRRKWKHSRRGRVKLARRARPQ